MKRAKQGKSKACACHPGKAENPENPKECGCYQLCSTCTQYYTCEGCVDSDHELQPDNSCKCKYGYYQSLTNSNCISNHPKSNIIRMHRSPLSYLYSRRYHRI